MTGSGLRCPACAAGNRAGRRFCSRCGAALVAPCPACGFANEPDERFCGGCGAELASAAPAPSPAVEAGVAERRQLTVLFCDLVGSTELSARLDPEDMREVIRAYQDACAAVVERWDGQVAKFMGDGVLAYFGYPRAHEDDAERAIRAGLALREAVARLDTRAGGPLAARIGIATGLVVVGDLIGEGAAQEAAVVGETPNLAARLQALAEPQSVVIAPSTRRLLGDLFELADLGERTLKGFTTPVQAWRVIGESRAESRFEALYGGRLVPLVGREHELAMLMERWRRAQDGEGQVVLISGEPGIGKSRLIRALRQELRDTPHVPISHFCSPHHSSSALHPIITQLERAAAFAPEDEPAARLAKLEALLGRATNELDEAVPLIATLLGIPFAERYPPLQLTPQRQKQRTLEVLIEQLAGLASDLPVVELYEDVHWVDPTTLELLDLLVERVRRLPVLALITFRPEFHAPWLGQSHVTQLPLNRLGRHQAAAIVARLTAGKALPGEIVEQIVARTDGVPLFVEELTKAVLESGLLVDAGDHYELEGPLRPLAIPATLQDSLMARLDRLASAKLVAQVGAAIGREFPHELLAAVAPLAEPELASALDQVLAAELIFRRGVPPHAIYSFKHALVRDAAYESLLRSARQRLHSAIADQLTADRNDVAPEIRAHHLTEAAREREAVPQWFLAGQESMARSAYREAAAHFRRGLALLPAVDDPAWQRAQEIRLQNALGLALLAISGPDALEAYSRARMLAEQAGNRQELFTALWGLWMVNHYLQRLDAEAEIVRELLTMVPAETDDALVLQAHHAAWTTSWARGEFAAANRHAKVGLGIYDVGRHRSHANVYAGHDPGVCCRWTLGLSCWFLGFPDRATAWIDECLALARRLGHPFTLLVALNLAAFVRQFRREPEEASAHARAVLQQADDQGLIYRPGMLAIDGWAAAMRGDGQAGLERIRAALAAAAARARLRRPFLLALLADACLTADTHEEGLAAIGEAQDLVQETGERFWEAEIHRLRGELLLASRSRAHPDAEACFDRALAVARAQGARSLELRAATSLARLWAGQGRRNEARDLLAPIYDWFTEGDTPDLKDARAVLGALGRPSDRRSVIAAFRPRSSSRTVTGNSRKLPR